MNRRVVLKWFSSLLALASAAVVAIPGMSFVLQSLRRPKSSAGVSRRVARLRDLPRGRPVQAVVTGRRRDAWTVHADAAIGRVWLVRHSDDGTPPEVARIEAFTSICPHLGCAIGLDAQGKQWVCPCHKAAFDFHGKKAPVEGSQRGNHAPRDMDALECQLARDAESGEWWVEVRYEKFEPGLTHQKPIA